MRQNKRQRVKGSSITQLQKLLGDGIRAHILKQNDIVSFAAQAGLNRATLYRLLQGKNTNTETLLRVLRALNRYDDIAQLIQEPEETPREKVAKSFKPKKTDPIEVHEQNKTGPDFDDLQL